MPTVVAVILLRKYPAISGLPDPCTVPTTNWKPAFEPKKKKRHEKMQCLHRTKAIIWLLNMLKFGYSQHWALRVFNLHVYRISVVLYFHAAALAYFSDSKHSPTFTFNNQCSCRKLELPRLEDVIIPNTFAWTYHEYHHHHLSQACY